MHHDIQDKTFYRGILENGHNAYLVELPDLKSLLHTSRYLMDEVTGQFYAVFGNSYQCMCTIPRSTHTWETGQLIDELAATRCAFGCMGPTGPAPTTQISQPRLADPVSTACTEDLIHGLTMQKPPPRTVPYQPPSFNPDRPTKCLTKEESLEVHHNYISAVSNLEHKKDLINRLKRSEPHNIPTYEAEMTCHMALHNDVLGRIHTILKQDDYFRTLEELPAIDGQHAYDDIQLFPELFDMPAVIERITSKADLIVKQLNRSCMYILTLLCLLHHHLQQEQPSHIRHNRPRNPHQAVHYHVDREPNGSTSSQDIPTKYSPMHSQFTPQGATPQTSPTDQQSPVRTRNNSFSQNSIPAPEATVPNTLEEKILKSFNGEGVQNSRKQATMSTTATQDSQLCFRCKQPGHWKKDCPELPYCSKCRT